MREFYILSYWAAAYLHSIGITPKRIELSPKGKRLFFYNLDEDIKLLLRGFYDNADLQKYIRSCVNLKTEMFKAKAKIKEQSN